MIHSSVALLILGLHNMMWSSVTSYADTRSGLEKLNSTYYSLIGNQNVEGINPRNASGFDASQSSSRKTSTTLSGSDNAESIPARKERYNERSRTRKDLTTTNAKDGIGSELPPLLQTIGNIFGMYEEEEQSTLLTSTQTLLRMSLRDIKQRNGATAGLNVAIRCQSEQDIMSSKSDTSVIERADEIPGPEAGDSFSSKSVFDVEEISDFQFYEEDDPNQPVLTPSVNNEQPHGETDQWSQQSSESILSVYSNPNYGKGQREHHIPSGNLSGSFMRTSERLLQDIINGRNSLRSIHTSRSQSSPNESLSDFISDSTQIIFPPLVSDSTFSTKANESGTVYEPLDEDRQDPEIPNPGLVVREYNQQLIGGGSMKKFTAGNPKCEFNSNTNVERNCGDDCNNDSIVTNIPCDSWMALPLRILPGDMIPHGLIIFLPVFFALISIFTALLL